MNEPNDRDARARVSNREAVEDLQFQSGPSNSVFKNGCLCSGEKCERKRRKKKMGNSKRHHQSTREEKTRRQYLGGKTGKITSQSQLLGALRSSWNSANPAIPFRGPSCSCKALRTSELAGKSFSGFSYCLKLMLQNSLGLYQFSAQHSKEMSLIYII